MKYNLCLKSLTASNVKNSVSAMLSAFALNALLLFVKLAGKTIAYKSTIEKLLVKNVTKKPSWKDALETPTDNLSISIQKLLSGPMNKLSTVAYRRDPEKRVMICGRCARYKFIPRKPGLWIMQGRCDYCLFQTWVCQIIEYMECDPTDVH